MRRQNRPRAGPDTRIEARHGVGELDGARLSAGDAFVCGGPVGRDGASVAVTARDRVLLFHDLEELAKLHFPKSEQAAALRDGRLAEVVWDRSVLVGGDGRGGPRDGVPPSLQVPEVSRESGGRASGHGDVLRHSRAKSVSRF